MHLFYRDRPLPVCPLFDREPSISQLYRLILDNPTRLVTIYRQRMFCRMLVSDGNNTPSKLESMGEGCFSHCISLTEVDIKECPLESLPPYTFDHCTKLLSIQAPNTITEIGEGAFYYCTSLTNCILPESVRTIGDYAFAGCSRIAGLSFLPEGTEK